MGHYLCLNNAIAFTHTNSSIESISNEKYKKFLPSSNSVCKLIIEKVFNQIYAGGLTIYVEQINAEIGGIWNI
jgi:hypothetical protein